MKKKKLFAQITIAATLLTAMPVMSFVTSTPAHAAQNISNNPVSDNTSTRSLTLWKYEIKDYSELGENGNGKETTVDKTPLAGITFKVVKVTPIGNASLTSPMTQKEGVDYEIDESFEPMEVATAADGKAYFDLGKGKAADGIYLVVENADPRVAKPVDPFFVYVPQTDREDHGSLIYDVNVYPKNIVNNALEPDKTIEEGKGFSIKAGEQFTWEATTNVPNGLYTVASQDMVISPVYNAAGDVVADKEVKKGDAIYADYFTMTDKMNEALTLDEVGMQYLDAGGNWVDLEADVHFKATTTIDNETGETTMVTSLTQAGMKLVSGNEKIRTVYTTHTDNDFNGVIENYFDTTYLVPGMKPVEVPSTETEVPEYFTGGFDIEKVDEKGQDLAGAEFHLADSLDNANNGIFLATDGNSYALDATLPEGVTFLVSTSDDKGHATFNGLELICLDAEGNKLPQTEIEKSYWVVETKAPNGYELLKDPQEVVVNLETKETVQLTVENKKQTTLPFTGGEGTTLVVVIALGAIAAGAGALALDKKHRNA